jgi:hypothetical protein
MTTWEPEEMHTMTSAGLVWYVHRVKKIDSLSYRVQVMRIRRNGSRYYTSPPIKNKVWTTSLELEEGDWIFRDTLGGDWTRLRGTTAKGNKK